MVTSESGNAILSGGANTVVRTGGLGRGGATGPGVPAKTLRNGRAITGRSAGAVPDGAIIGAISGRRDMTGWAATGVLTNSCTWADFKFCVAWGASWMILVDFCGKGAVAVMAFGSTRLVNNTF